MDLQAMGLPGADTEITDTIPVNKQIATSEAIMAQLGLNAPPTHGALQDNFASANSSSVHFGGSVEGTPARNSNSIKYGGEVGGKSMSRELLGLADLITDNKEVPVELLHDMQGLMDDIGSGRIEIRATTQGGAVHAGAGLISLIQGKGWNGKKGQPAAPAAPAATASSSPVTSMLKDTGLSVLGSFLSNFGVQNQIGSTGGIGAEIGNMLSGQVGNSTIGQTIMNNPLFGQAVGIANGVGSALPNIPIGAPLPLPSSMPGFIGPKPRPAVMGAGILDPYMMLPPPPNPYASVYGGGSVDVDNRIRDLETMVNYMVNNEGSEIAPPNRKRRRVVEDDYDDDSRAGCGVSFSRPVAANAPYQYGDVLA